MRIYEGAMSCRRTISHLSSSSWIIIQVRGKVEVFHAVSFSSAKEKGSYTLLDVTMRNALILELASIWLITSWEFSLPNTQALCLFTLPLSTREHRVLSRVQSPLDWYINGCNLSGHYWSYVILCTFCEIRFRLSSRSKKKRSHYMETIVYHSVTLWSNISGWVFCRIFIKCDKGVEYKMLCSKAEDLSFIKICSVAITYLLTYLLTHLLTYTLTYLLTYLHTYLLHGAESFLRS